MVNQKFIEDKGKEVVDILQDNCNDIDDIEFEINKGNFIAYIKNKKYKVQQDLEDLIETVRSKSSIIIDLMEDAHIPLSKKYNTIIFEDMHHIIVDINKNIPLVLDVLLNYLTDVLINIPRDLFNSESENAFEVDAYTNYYLIRIESITNMVDNTLSMFSNFMQSYASILLVASANAEKDEEDHNIKTCINKIISGDSDYHKVIEAIHTQFELIKTLIPSAYTIPST